MRWDPDPEKRPKMNDVFRRMKSLFVECVDQSKGSTYQFWLKNFGDEVTDSVPLYRLLKAMPGSYDDGVIDRRLYLLKLEGFPMDTPVSLTRVRDLVCWYGNWIEIKPLESIVTFLKAKKWMVRDIGESVANNWLMEQYEKTGHKCFLVRCCNNNPVKEPYMISIHTGKLPIIHHKIMRTTTGFCCPKLSKTICQKSVPYLINALIRNKVLTGELFLGCSDTLTHHHYFNGQD